MVRASGAGPQAFATAPSPPRATSRSTPAPSPTRSPARIPRAQDRCPPCTRCQPATFSSWRRRQCRPGDTCRASSDAVCPADRARCPATMPAPSVRCTGQPGDRAGARDAPRYRPQGRGGVGSEAMAGAKVSAMNRATSAGSVCRAPPCGAACLPPATRADIAQHRRGGWIFADGAYVCSWPELRPARRSEDLCGLFEKRRASFRLASTLGALPFRGRRRGCPDRIQPAGFTGSCTSRR